MLQTMPTPAPSPAYVYHYDMPTQTCIDDLTGTVTCYDQPKFIGTISHDDISCKTKPCGSIYTCSSSDVNGCGMHGTTIPVKLDTKSNQTCLEDKHGYETGWTLDVYDGNEKLLGSLRCKNGRLTLLRAQVVK